MDQDLIENALRRTSKLIPGVSNLSYVDRLRAIDIPSIKCRRIRGNVIQVYKILHGEDESLKALFDVDSIFITRVKNKETIC